MVYATCHPERKHMAKGLCAPCSKTTPEYKVWHRQYVLKRRRQNLALVNSLRDRPCTDCGIQYPSYVMQFDHVRGRKMGDIARMRQNMNSPKRLLDELAKCEVVCANCHASRTHFRRNNIN